VQAEAQAAAAATARRAAETERDAATADRRRLRRSMPWAGARFRSGALLAVVAVCGLAAGFWLGGRPLSSPSAQGEMPELRLRLDYGVEAIGRRASLPPAAREP
jgi:hypothetical protein